jgi:hypothetical protein
LTGPISPVLTQEASKRSMAKPNFMCVGAEKSGTTSLWVLLRQHPDIFLYEEKETSYFSRTLRFTPPHHYEFTLFRNYAGQRAIGEISPEYLRSPEAPAIVREALGPIKIIVCLREPARRAFSHYLLCLRLAEENRSFADACQWDAGLPSWSGDFLDFRRAYVRGSRYAYQIEAWRRAFGIENTFFCIMERDMKDSASTAAMLKRLFRFLDVEDLPTPKLAVPNTSGPAPKVTFATSTGSIKYPNTQEVLFEPGDILVQTGNRALDRVLRRPSPELTAFMTKMAREMTHVLSPEDEARFRRQYFASVADETGELIGEDLNAIWRDPSRPAVSDLASETTSASQGA